jgi:hypothetical protein
MLWRPLGVTLALWACFGWMTPWFTALLPYGREVRIPNPAAFILAAALLGHLSAAVVQWLGAPGLTAAGARLLALLGTLGAGWWAFVAAPLGGLAASAAAERSHWQATWVVVLCLGYAWWRGGRMSAGEALEPESTLRRLFTGALLAAAAIILFPTAWRAGGPWFLPLYVGGGLAGVTLGQVEDASRRRGGRPLPFGLSWHAGLLLGVATVIALGVVVGLALTSDPAWGAAEAAARALASAARVVASVLAPVVEALLRFLGPIFDAIIGLLRSWMEGAGEARITPPPPLSLGGEEGLATEEASVLLAQMGVVLRIIITAVAVAVLLWMAVRTTRRPRGVPEDREPEAFEPVPDPAVRRKGQGLAGVMRSVARLRDRARGLVHALLVRRVYAQLLEWGARQGRARRPAETPLEFGAALDGLRPDLREDLAAITRAYLQVRYGEMPESADMISAVLASWDRVRGSVPPARRPGEGNSW